MNKVKIFNNSKVTVRQFTIWKTNIRKKKGFSVLKRDRDREREKNVKHHVTIQVKVWKRKKEEDIFNFNKGIIVG